MARQMKELLAQHATKSFVGRTEELVILLQALRWDGPLVYHVHGIGGIGKSSLLNVFVEQARVEGATVVRLDCRAIEPSRRGFLHELGGAIGGELTTVEKATERLAQLGERVILTLDTYEVFRLMDTWLRQRFVPNLHDNVRVVLFGREPPVSAWHLSPGWQGLFQSIRLDPLSEQESAELLVNAGVDEADAYRINRFTRGHPLALKLAVAAILERPALNLEEIASQHVVAELTRLYLADVRDALTRETLEAASVVRRTTRSLINAMLPNVAPQDAYERLQSLPFVDSGSDGLIIHDAIQQAIATALQAADPNRFQVCRQAAWKQLRSEVRTASKAEIWRYTADMLYLIEEPILREAFFPSDMQPLAVEPALLEDGPTIQNITHLQEGPQAATLLNKLWDCLPRSFRTVRNRNGVVVGFYNIFDPMTVNPTILQNDPMLKNWWQHLQDESVPKGQQALFCRRWLDVEVGEAPSPVQAACWLDIKGMYMEMRSSLRRIYCTAIDAEGYAPMLIKLGFQLIPEAAVELDSQTYHTAVNDFGPALVTGWITRLVGAELGIKKDDLLDVEAHELIVDERRIALTPLEFGVMHYLHGREGQAVSRISLLSDVWGYDYQGGSNVVDAAIRSLRKKLGVQASVIETVTGVGYRFRQE